MPISLTIYVINVSPLIRWPQYACNILKMLYIDDKINDEISFIIKEARLQATLI